MRQCAAVLDNVLEIGPDGFPATRPVRCGQTVGLRAVVDKAGRTWWHCAHHDAEVAARVRVSDAEDRARRDADEDARFEALRRIGREATQRAADRSEELRGWGGKYAGWRT